MASLGLLGLRPGGETPPARPQGATAAGLLGSFAMPGSRAGSVGWQDNAAPEDRRAPIGPGWQPQGGVALPRARRRQRFTLGRKTRPVPPDQSRVEANEPVYNLDVGMGRAWSNSLRKGFDSNVTRGSVQFFDLPPLAYATEVQLERGLHRLDGRGGSHVFSMNQSALCNFRNVGPLNQPSQPLPIANNSHVLPYRNLTAERALPYTQGPVIGPTSTAAMRILRAVANAQ